MLICFLVFASISAQAGLVGHWKLDESLGTSASDSSGSGYTGTLQNMSGTEWGTGEIDGALTLDGANDYISLPRANVLEDGNSGTHYLSATAWIRDDSGGATGWSTIVGTGDGGWLLARNGSSGLLGAFWLTSGGLVTCNGTTSINISDGQWHHVALVYIY